ncbi:hydrogen peroxide-inducible genes activator [Cognatishimia sp. SS12]|uniref:hydrogen peroxide-inducible genes activator n=1 Tax=Cognatishimia sp. SS12 TaxID=2979465 RepID=UPI0023300B86|nr:hydrogen peroxide-inducible genes activator [Cognatishimia sp. SS12]MDC0738647.1 hydrogen peroxide-inducible genes activator [Cognatishimia sp. SS12]
MRPTLRQLQYIVTVAETGRIGTAASRLNVSQPSLSAQLAEVEADLGVTLFMRGRSGAVITAAGEEVVRRARRLLRDHQDLRSAARGGGIFHGRLRLGVLPSLGPYLLPNAVRRLHQEHPEFRLVVREEGTRELDERLRNGQLDMIISTPEDHPGTRRSSLFRESFWVALTLDNPLAAEHGPIGLPELKGQIFLTLGQNHRLSHTVAALAQEAGGFVSDEYEGTSLDAIRLMAATGSGVAILPQIYALTEAKRSPDIVLRKLVADENDREISLIEPPHPDVRPGSDELIGILRSEAKQMLSEGRV